MPPLLVYMRRHMVYTAVVLRKQIYLDERLDRRLRGVARSQGRSAASLIREAVGEYLEGHAPSEDDPIRALIGAFKGGRPDAALEHDKYLYGEDD